MYYGDALATKTNVRLVFVGLLFGPSSTRKVKYMERVYSSPSLCAAHSFFRGKDA